MTYNAAETEYIDIIRGLVRDTSNDPATEYFPDATYDSVIARFDNWKRAAAMMARRVAGVIEDRPSSISAPSDGSISWSNRTRSLYAFADLMDAEAAMDDADAAFGTVITITDRFLTGPVREGADEWSS